MFPSFVQYPTNCRFEGQDDDEKIILLLRAHPITNLSWIIPALLVALVPIFLPKLLQILNTALPSIPSQFIWALIIINYLVVLVIIFEGFLFWYFNVHILTNKRIVDIDFHSMLYKNVDLAPLINIQEANSHVKGIFGLIFHFGDVFIQTAGAKIAVDFYKVPRPHEVADIIMDQAHKMQGGDRGS